MMAWIINGGVVLAIVCLWLSSRYWRRMAAKAFFQHAIACYKKEDREELARRSVLAGSRHAQLLYALTCPELFDKARPLRLFGLGNIRCVFVNYYYPKRYEYWLQEEQSEFVQEVYDFKEGKDDCWEYFSQAFRVLGVHGDVTAMFMPCSTERRYYKRFSKLAAYLEASGYAVSGLDLIGITQDREC